ncbi:type I restriction endonuclease subunit M, partial [Bathymodiolus thermophilus thioautotrophic gill symbiont]
RNLGKTNPLNEQDLAEFITLQKTQASSENSWTLNIADLDQNTLDLSAKNPNIPEEEPLRTPGEILAAMKILDKKGNEAIKNIMELI